jgi:hypothetical protein
MAREWDGFCYTSFWNYMWKNVEVPNLQYDVMTA